MQEYFKLDLKYTGYVIRHLNCVNTLYVKMGWTP